MSHLSHTPDDVTIQPRNRQHALAEPLARDWLDNHPFKTAWFNSLSMTFPRGEKFFIDSVRHYIDRIDDPKLLEEIGGFCGQEGFHRREHEAYNRTLCELRGYDYDYLDGRLEKNIARATKMLTPLQQLAATAALEHITAVMAEAAFYSDFRERHPMDPAMDKLWEWHAIEELEHKSVAFDVYRAVGGDEKMRKAALRQSTFFLLVDALLGAMHMLRRDGNLWRPKVWAEGWKFLFFKGGLIRNIWGPYKQYFRDGFHPWDRDTRAMLNEWKVQNITG